MDEVNRLKSENVDLVNSLKQIEERMEGARGALGGPQQPPTPTKQTTQTKEPEPSYIDVEGITDSKVKIGSHRVVVKSPGKRGQVQKEFPEIEWDVVSGNNFAYKNGDVLVCESKGDILLKATYNGKEITRSIKIID